MWTTHKEKYTGLHSILYTSQPIAPFERMLEMFNARQYTTAAALPGLFCGTVPQTSLHNRARKRKPRTLAQSGGRLVRVACARAPPVASRQIHFTRRIRGEQRSGSRVRGQASRPHRRTLSGNTIGSTALSGPDAQLYHGEQIAPWHWLGQWTSGGAKSPAWSGASELFWAVVYVTCSIFASFQASSQNEEINSLWLVFKSEKRNCIIFER